ncbi:MAG: hypothetical protein JNK38_01010 [Acidobacteria bacterium]|nr:hypothetical protein [Acidobacteriota bacterium]
MEHETDNNKAQRKAVSAVTLDPQVQQRLLAIAAEKDWSAAKTGGWLIKLGLEKLDAEQQSRSTQEIAVAA